MIVGQTKPIKELIEMTNEYNRLLIIGCGTCITVCYAGGEKEVALVASALRMARKIKSRTSAPNGAKQALTANEITIKRQCEIEFVEELDALVKDVDAILTLACAAGIQTLADRYTNLPVLPGVNTQFIGMVREQGVWEEMCIGCGDCITHRTGGLCAVARCPKGQLNAPCGGANTDGKCEVNENLPCIWFKIAERLKATNKLATVKEIIEPKRWSTSHSGGVRINIMETMRKTKLENDALVSIS